MLLSGPALRQGTPFADTLRRIRLHPLWSKMFGNKAEEAVLGQLHNSGIDGIFTITLLDRARERDFSMGKAYSRIVVKNMTKEGLLVKK